MTLNTSIAAITPADPHEVFHKCRELLGATDAHPYQDAPARYGEPGAWHIGNARGIGLSALLEVEYRPGLEPLRTPEQAAQCDGDCMEEPCDHRHHEPACWLQLSFDTAYSYYEHGLGCGELHAQLLFELGQWFDERGIGWGWQNEFTGEWHYEDKYRALKDLCTDGGRAMAWFTEIVMPLVEQISPLDRPPTEGLRGMFRVQVEEDGQIVGDSGWHQNLVTNAGFEDFCEGRRTSTTHEH